MGLTVAPPTLAYFFIRNSKYPSDARLLHPLLVVHMDDMDVIVSLIRFRPVDRTVRESGSRVGEHDDLADGLFRDHSPELGQRGLHRILSNNKGQEAIVTLEMDVVSHESGLGTDSPGRRRH